MKQFIPILIALVAFATFAVGCTQDNVESLKQHTQETGNTVEVTETAPDGTVLQHLKVSPDRVESTSVRQAPDTEKASDVAGDSEGGDQANARLSVCTHSGNCTLARHAEHSQATVRSSRAEVRFGTQLAYATPYAKSLSFKTSNRVPPIGGLSSRQ